MFMQSINSYWKQLTPEEIVNKKHREFVGGLWDELGRLQFDFMVGKGLLPHHVFLDVGCGALRGGVYFINYLNMGMYQGLDINESLIEAAKKELADAGLSDKYPKLLVNDRFEASLFGRNVDFALALSVFTHLYTNHIVRCLVEVRKVLQPDGKFYATFFEAPYSAYLEPITHEPGSVVTKYDADPFHYSYEEINGMAKIAGMTVERIADSEWVHPRNQKMFCFKTQK